MPVKISKPNHLLQIASHALFWAIVINPVMANADTLFGIVPQQSATKLARAWVPFIKRLSEETGVSVRFATLKDIPNFKQCHARGAYELAYMNPYHFTVFNKLSGYRATVGQMIAGGYRGKT